MALTLLAALCLCPVAQAGSKAFASDERLKRPIGLHDKIVSLKTFAEHLQRESGVTIEVAAYIADRKITAIFHDRPVSEVMRAVETLFFMQWQPTSTGYRLTLPSKIQAEEKGMLDLEARLARAALEKKLAAWAEIGQMPYETVEAERKKLLDDFPRLRGDTSEAGKAKFQAAAERFGALSDNVWAATAAALAPHLRDHVRELIDGATVFASTRETDGVAPLSSDFLRGPGFNHRSYTSAIAIVQYNDDEHTLGGPIRLFDSSGQNAVTALSTTALIDENSPELAAAPLAKRMTTWGSEADPSILDRKLSLPEPPKPVTGYLSKAYSLAEHLEYIAARADIPVIADAYRMSVSRESFQQVEKIGAYLESLRLPYRSTRPYYRILVHASDGWLMARTDAYWRQLAREIPERIFVPLEEKAASPAGANIDDFAAFVAKLTPLQVRGLFQRSMHMLMRFTRHPLSAGRSLRFLATLSPGQRAQSMKREGLSMADMNDDQRALYFEAVSGLLREGQVPESLLSAFFPNARVDLSTLVFSFECRRGMTDVWPDDEITATSQQQSQRMDGWRVNFEYGRPGESGATSGFQFAAR